MYRVYNRKTQWSHYPETVRCIHRNQRRLTKKKAGNTEKSSSKIYRAAGKRK